MSFVIGCVYQMCQLFLSECVFFFNYSFSSQMISELSFGYWA